ncbi:putative flap endonuclease-1-like 5' DNA nuclease [Oxalobacteraceae bacterium GrIS 1.11]
MTNENLKDALKSIIKQGKDAADAAKPEEELSQDDLSEISGAGAPSESEDKLESCGVMCGSF